MNRTFIQTKATKTTTFDGTGVDVSALAGDWTLVLDLLASSGTIRFVFEDSTDNFVSDKLAGGTFSVTGGAGSGPRRFAFEKRDFPNLRVGIASAQVRLRIVENGGSVTYQSWIEN